MIADVVVVSTGTLARLQLFAAALLFSTGGAAIKLCGLSSWQVAGFRSATAAVALLFMMPLGSKRWSWQTLIVGAAYASTMILFVASNKLTTAANTIFLQSTAPFYVLLLAPWLLREPIRRHDLAFMSALGIGLAFFFIGTDPVLESAPDPRRGNLLAVLSGISWALTVVGLRWIGKSEDGSAGSALVTGNVLAFLACLPWALPLQAAAFTDWLIIGYLGTFQIGLAYVCLSAGVRHLPAFETSLLLLLEPVLNPVWTWISHREVPGSWALLGGVIILFSTLAKTWLDARIAKRSRRRFKPEQAS